MRLQLMVTIYANGSSSLECLTIRGGCDWYEEANAEEVIKPGYVAIIDKDRPLNSVKLSTNAYDQLVTGVVSGAGGINPGIGFCNKTAFLRAIQKSLWEEK